ncbi:MAG TPA: holo-ACP synthase [Acidimicrobiales bacterium]|nr:holo-ACP synthase [Acidimicrobiales bacterium]
MIDVDVAGAVEVEVEVATGLADAHLVGIGVDAVDVERFRRLLARRPNFSERFFSATERADAGLAPDPTESLAARFAAKEAVMKALGSGLGSFALNEVEVRRTEGTDATRNNPYLVLHGAAAALADRQHAGPLHLSLSHTGSVAIAFVVAERATPCAQS